MINEFKDLNRFKDELKGWQKDPIVDAVCEDLQRRSKVGIEKYGTTLDGNPLTMKEWVIHAYEESLDFCLYLKRIMKDLK